MPGQPGTPLAGYARGADPDGSGLTGLRDRAEALGGTLTLASPPGRGTSVEVRLPAAAR